MALPGTVGEKYKQEKRGFYGEFGQGANVDIRFIQSAINYQWLDNIKLIEEIEGSDKWDVRDLFQRNVDQDRVRSGLLPYLKDDTKVKFFAPLTLVLLPMDDADVKDELGIPVHYEEDIDGHLYDEYENPEYFKFCKHKNNPEFSYVKWNGEKVKVVAVDGQHRLSALKRWRNDPEGPGKLAQMTIPVVIIGFFKSTPKQHSPSLLEVVRKTFVYINSKAQNINESRRILLDDESVHCVCTQEFVQHAHTNDQQPESELDIRSVPLMMIDWRGDEREGGKVHSPSSVFSVKDIYDWLFEFILVGSKGDFDKNVIPRLGLGDEIPEFTSDNFPLTHFDSEIVRRRFRGGLLKAMNLVLEGIDPYSLYISKIREIQELSVTETSDTGRHAFKWLCFGRNISQVIDVENIEAEYQNLTDRLRDAKEECIHFLLTRDIGIRAVWSSFSILKNELDKLRKNTVDWVEFSQLFVDSFNEVYQEEWFEQYEKFTAPNKRIITHIVYSAAGTIVNYKPADVNKAFGPLLSMLMAKKLVGTEGTALLESVWNNQKDALINTYNKGVRTDVRGEMNATFSGTKPEFADELKKRVTRISTDWESKLKSRLGLDA